MIYLFYFKIFRKLTVPSSCLNVHKLMVPVYKIDINGL